MIKEIIKAIHALRVFFLAIIIVSFLLFLGLNPIQLAQVIGANLGLAKDAGTNMQVGVPENPYNTLALQLKAKEDQLTEKERIVAQYQKDLEKQASLQNKLIVFLTIGIIVLFILIVLNYYMDFKRRRLAKQNFNNEESNS